MIKGDSFGTSGSLKVLLFVMVVGLFVTGSAIGAEPERVPVLSAPQVKPYNRNEAATYRFSVHYSSPDHSLPRVIQVWVDGKPIALTAKGGKGYDATYLSQPVKLEPGHHKYYFACEDGRGLKDRTPRYGEWDGPYVGRSWRKSYNTYPALSDGHLVQGETGDEETYFTFSVHYGDYDSTPPKKVLIMIDGLSHPMKLLKGSPQNGTYIFNAYLDTPPHAYYFAAEDPAGARVTLPVEGFLRGPAVGAIPNTNPELTDERVEPPIGGLSDVYLFRVRYWDAEKDPPAIIQVYVDGFPHNMTLGQGAPYDGVYCYKTKLPLSNFHNFYFRAEDGRQGEASIPVQGAVHGPVVVNQ
jgi:hypothetical protein